MAGEGILEVAAEIGAFCRGKNYGKLLKQLAEHGPEDCVLVLQPGVPPWSRPAG